MLTPSSEQTKIVVQAKLEIRGKSAILVLRELDLRDFLLEQILGLNFAGGADISELR